MPAHLSRSGNIRWWMEAPLARPVRGAEAGRAVQQSHWDMCGRIQSRLAAGGRAHGSYLRFWLNIGHFTIEIRRKLYLVARD